MHLIMLLPQNVQFLAVRLDLPSHRLVRFALRQPAAAVTEWQRNRDVKRIAARFAARFSMETKAVFTIAAATLQQAPRTDPLRLNVTLFQCRKITRPTSAVFDLDSGFDLLRHFAMGTVAEVR
jgi:hypothetical protein